MYALILRVLKSQIIVKDELELKEISTVLICETLSGKMPNLMLFRPYFCKPDEAEEIHGSYDSQNEDRKDQWGKNQESKQGIVTADDEPCKDSYTVDSWNNEGGVNQEKGGLKAQMHASNYNLDEKDANDSVEESKDDSYSSCGYCRSNALYSTIVECMQMHSISKSFI